MSDLRFAILGTGFWSRFQLAAWHEVGGVECVAMYNRTRSKAEKLAREFGVPAVYDNPADLLEREQLDFIDIITEVPAHKPLVLLAAQHKTPVICQKPMAASLVDAEEMVAACREAGIPYFVHENWRWQTPIRTLKGILDSGVIGTPFRARIECIWDFPTFKNQPMLAELENLIIADLGSHTLDISRFFFGDVGSLYAHAFRVHPKVKGEAAATIMLKMKSGVGVVVEMAYVENYIERDAFPQTKMFIEGTLGSLELDIDYWIRVTTADGTHSRRYPPPRYPWADPAYDVVHSSIVPCNADLLCALRGERPAETTGEDNLKTVRLVFAAYDSARRNQLVQF